ncbi:MAG: glycine cleavage system aminomethyltransferase T, partial [Rhizobiaceae bacterium]|nr:glycine cleavage system aminomethyltransferase T [Rhizobiaceae bacterium]
MSGDELKHLPLEDLHSAAGARFGAFAGWSMPLTYPAGVMKEHLHTREAAGLFDISHMKLFRLTGPGAAGLLARACPLDPAALEASQSKYTFLLNGDAGILDDLIVTRLGDEAFMVVANAGNAQADEARLREVGQGFDCRIEPLDRVFLAIQGPDAAAVLDKAGVPAALTFMHGLEPRDGWFMSRSGYTGEDGFEIALPPDQAPAFAARLLADERLQWIGLAARDSLRLEAGLCL